MFSQSILWDIMRLEMFLGNSDRCHDCGHEFLAHSDGCPNCGGWRTTKLHSTEEKREKWDMETFPVTVINFDNPNCCFHTVNIGDFSPYPIA